MCVLRTLLKTFAKNRLIRFSQKTLKPILTDGLLRLPIERIIIKYVPAGPPKAVNKQKKNTLLQIVGSHKIFR